MQHRESPEMRAFRKSLNRMDWVVWLSCAMMIGLPILFAFNAWRIQ